MLAAIALATLIAGPATLELNPTGDVWVYPHASDPAKCTNLDVWGAGGYDVTKDVTEMQSFSYSYLRFDVSKVPAGKVVGATLMLTAIGKPQYELLYAKQHPVRVRPLSGDFLEKTWDYAMAERILPESGEKAIFGSGAPEALPAEGQDAVISIDLLKGPNDFRAYLNAGRSASAKSIALALTSTMDVEDKGRTYIYQLHSREAEKASRRPLLKLTIDG